MKTSNVFDMKRFAVHDGVGIRTTVFFKGCPLRCLWCQNPEGLLMKRQPIYVSDKCIHCRLCERYADEGQLVYKDRPYFEDDYQGDYHNVIDICPSGAIRYDSQEYSVEELFEKIKEDEVFFRNGGGVTFSGGEPLMQGEFLVDILKLCHEHHIHTAIESSFYGRRELVQEILPYLDQIYCDMKIFDEKDHRHYTGVSNDIIKQNITYMLTSSHRDKVTIRTPLIPHITATTNNIEDIVRFITSQYSHVHYELLNYNPLASAKYQWINQDYPLKDAKPFTKEEMEQFYDIVRKNHLENLIIE